MAAQLPTHEVWVASPAPCDARLAMTNGNYLHIVRHLLLITTILLGTTALRAQGGTEADSTRKNTISGAGGLLFSGGPVPLNNAFVANTGLGGGVVINEKLLIGGYAMAMPSPIYRGLTFPGDTTTWEGRFELVHGG